MSAATRGKRKLDETEENEIDLTAEEPEPSLHATECTICCEKCTTSGEHRLASLACGHLFGHGCIEKWVKQSKTCPVCNQNVRRNDVRLLFTDCIAVVDNSRQEEWNQKYLAEKAQRTAMEMEVAKLKLQHAALQLECEKHKHRVMELLEENSTLKAHATRPTLPQPPHPPWGYTKLASIPCVDARVCAIAPGCDLLCIGSKSSHPEHPHGLVQVSLMDLNHRVVIPLHRSAIRDIAISHDSAYIATTAMDAKLHITSPSAQKSILHFDMPGKLGWSCTWDDSNPHGIYVGHQNGHVSLFDMRRPGAAAAESLVHHFQQPVHSVRTLSMGDQPVVVAATFSGLSVWTNRVHAMHMEVKNCCAMANNQMEPTQLVVSSRSTVTTSQSNATPAQHFVVSLKFNEDKAVETESDAVLQGHTTPSAISRSAIWSLSPADQVLVASGDVQSHQLLLWDVTSSAIVRQYECGKSPVVDVQHAVQRGDWSSERAYLASLATDELVLYKAKTVAVHPVRIDDVR